MKSSSEYNKFTGFYCDSTVDLNRTSLGRSAQLAGVTRSTAVVLLLLFHVVTSAVIVAQDCEIVKVTLQQLLSWENVYPVSSRYIHSVGKFFGL